MKLTNGKVYEITDNTVVFIELDSILNKEQIDNLLESFKDIGCPVHVFSKGVKVKVLENHCQEFTDEIKSTLKSHGLPTYVP